MCCPYPSCENMCLFSQPIPPTCLQTLQHQTPAGDPWGRGAQVGAKLGDLSVAGVRQAVVEAIVRRLPVLVARHLVLALLGELRVLQMVLKAPTRVHAATHLRSILVHYANRDWYCFPNVQPSGWAQGILRDSR